MNVSQNYEKKTTFVCRFVPPSDMGGLPIDSYAVEYKRARQDWGSARRRVWPVGKIIIFE